MLDSEMSTAEEDQKKEPGDWPGIRLMEWCREYSRKQIEQIEREVGE